MKFPESRVVAHKWRAITLANCKYASFNGDNAAKDLASLCADLVANVLNIVRWSPTSTSSSTASKDEIAQHFEGRFLSISELTLKIDRALDEQVISRDLVLHIAQAGAPFDPETVIDIDQDNTSHDLSHRRGGRVVCTTDLGLRSEGAENALDDTNFGPVVLLKAKAMVEWDIL